MEDDESAMMPVLMIQLHHEHPCHGSEIEDLM